VASPRTWSFRLGALALGFGLAFGLVEVGLRFLGYSFDVGRERARVVRGSSTPLRRYELIPGASGHAWLTDVSINSLGLRGPEVSREPVPGRRRLAILGDSVGFGLRVRDDETIGAQLQERLGEGVEVLNFSVTGYDNLQQLAQWREQVLPTKPEAALLLYCLNDVGVADEWNWSRDRGDELHNLGPRGSRAWHFGVHLFEAAASLGYFWWQNRLPVYQETYAEQIAPIGADEAELRGWMAQAGTSHPVLQGWYTHEPRVGRLRWVMGQLAAEAREAGVPLTVVIVPFLERRDGEYPYTVIHRIVAHEVRRAGLPVLDLADPLTSGDPNRYRGIFFDDIHLNAAGTLALADHLVRYLAGWPGGAPLRRTVLQSPRQD
jgi:lysophospholipase L1-like esterase